MAKKTSVILGEHFDKFIQSERIKVEQINQALKIGESSGMAKEFDSVKFKQEMKSKLGVDE